uniref:Uncharacterized protein n=1 Tax=Arundo donax TaxID=35708 RepID=A0A0A9GPP5_ARUDO
MFLSLLQPAHKDIKLPALFRFHEFCVIYCWLFFICFSVW